MELSSQIIILMILLALSAFFSGAEVALVSLSRIRVRQMIANKKLSSIYVHKLKENPHRMLATILIGNNVVNVAASAITTAIMIEMFDNYAIGIATGVMTLLILIFGEITPKSVATVKNESVSRIVAMPIWYLSVVLKPVLYVLDLIRTGLFKVMGIKSKKRLVTEEDILHMISQAEEEGSLKEVEKTLLKNVFEFDDTNVSEIMTPKTDMIMIDSKTKVAQALSIIKKRKLSRLPVFEKDRDRIVGIVYLKDLMKYLGNAQRIGVGNIMKTPYFVPEIKKISNLLRQFQKRKEQMAIVVDEHGCIAGLVTLEDVLEEIVGEIMDETDKMEPHIIKKSKDVWQVNGKTDIDDINSTLKMKIHADDDFDTIGGFILHKTGRIPEIGEKVEHEDFHLFVEDVAENRVIQLRIEKKS